MQTHIISALSKEGLDTLTERYLAEGYEIATEVFKHGGYWGVGVRRCCQEMQGQSRQCESAQDAPARTAPA